MKFSRQGRRLQRRLAAAAAALLLGVPAAAAQRVVDGNSLVLDGTTYRLHGIDAPDPAQICVDGWPAGYAAEEYLSELIEGRHVTCTPTTGDRKGEMVAICRADGVDLGAAMVTGGYAFAFVPYSARYITQEDAARAAHRGVHAHRCLVPWEWQARLRKAR